MIGIDWGTTSFRAYRIQGGAVAARHAGPHGILGVPPGGFADALRAAVQPWLDAGERHILMSGMVGSRQGWQEAPYLPCPAGAAELAAALVRVPFDGAQVLLVPGLMVPGDTPEVMRGEEVQVVGAMVAAPDVVAPGVPVLAGRTAGTPMAGVRDATACLPGSHSKWVQISGGRIMGFTTHMTGEAFAALRDHTILGRLLQPGAAPDPDAFLRGVAQSGAPGGLLHHLFGVRTLGLFGKLPEAAGESYLSGLLIGHEVRAATVSHGLSGPVHLPIHLIGEPALCALYARALAACGGTSAPVAPDAAARGLAMIGAHAPWT